LEYGRNKKAKQRSRERNIKGGDRNISYFQDIANQRTGTKEFLVWKVMKVCCT
jgi:hypothetical protein